TTWKRKRRPKGAVRWFSALPQRSGRAGLDLRARLRRGRNRDAARLQLLRHAPHEIDVQQAVAELGAFHLDMVGELEAALEGAAGNAAIQDLALVGLAILTALALHGQHVLVYLDAEVLVAETGD